MPTTPDNKREECEGGICGILDSFPPIETYCDKHSPDSFLTKTLAEFDEKFVKIGEFGVKSVPPEIIKRFLSSALNAQREEAYREGKKYTLDDLDKHSSKIRQVAREEIREKVESLKEYRHLNFPDPLIRKLDFLALLFPNNKENGKSN